MKQASAFLLTLALTLNPFNPILGAFGDVGDSDRAAGQDEAQAAFDKLMISQGLKLDLPHGLLGVPVNVAIKHDLLEYLLVGPEGKGHESLLGTAAKPSVVNAALLALGAKPGKNASWSEPAEGQEALLSLPSGDGFYLYVGWREGEESYLFRIEDVISNVLTGRSMRRHKWVYLGSRFASPREGEPEVFVADATENLINLSFFYSGNTLLTAALSACQEQTIWSANAPLLPPGQSKLQLIFSKQRLRSLPPAWEQQLPLVQAPEEVEQDGR